MKNIIFTFAFCLLVQGCVSTPTTMKLVPQVLNGQKIIIQEDAEAVISHKKSSVVLRPPPDGYPLEGRPMIYVSVYGIGKPFDFSTEDIKVFVDGNPHRIFTHHDLVEETKQRQANEVAAAELEYEALSRRAADTAHTSSSDPEVFKPGYDSKRDMVPQTPETSGHIYAYDISSVAQSLSQFNAEREAKKGAIEMRAKKIIAVLDEIMLKKTTILPYNWHRGYVGIEKMPDPTRSHEIKIIVTVAGEEHEFLLNHVIKPL